MSNREAIDAYVGGRISRRTLVRRLVTGGVSFGAAAAYAEALDPARAIAGTGSRFGPSAYHVSASTKIIEDPLGEVIKKGRVRVEVQSHQHISSAGSNQGIFVRLLRPSSKWPDAIIGHAEFTLNGGSKTYGVPIDYHPPYSLDALRKEKHRAHLSVSVIGMSGQKWAEMSDEAILKR